jgi:hypothetical protein
MLQKVQYKYIFNAYRYFAIRKSILIDLIQGVLIFSAGL